MVQSTTDLYMLEHDATRCSELLQRRYKKTRKLPSVSVPLLLTAHQRQPIHTMPLKTSKKGKGRGKKSRAARARTGA